MMMFTFFLSAFLVLQITNSHPSPVEGLQQFSEYSENLEAKIRDKRKSEVEVPVLITTTPQPLPPAQVPNVEEIVSPPEHEKIEDSQKLLDDKEKLVDIQIPTIQNVAEGENAPGRFKKQAVKIVPCNNPLCGLHVNNDQNHDVVILKHDELAVPRPSGEVKPYMMQARTIDPIYSFGPLSVNGNTGYGLHAASSLNYAVPSRPMLTPSTSYASHTSYSSPSGGLSYHVVMPYASPIHHRQPTNEHSFSISHTPVEIKPVMYYEAPEPLVVDAHEDQSSHIETSNAVHDVSPVSLYCQTMKSKDLAKTLTSAVKRKSNESDDTLANIKRVNEIKDEIVNLNAAAQRIADEQEKINRMNQEAMVPSQQDYLMRNADPMMDPMMMRSMDPMMMRSMNPMLMRTHPRIPHYSPYMYHHYQYMKPMYKEADELEPSMAVEAKKDERETPEEENYKEEPKVKVSEDKPKEELKVKVPEDKPKEEQTKVVEQKERSNMREIPSPYYYQGYARMRNYPPGFGDYYRYPTESFMPSYRTFPGVYGVEYVPYQRSETGFPTSPLFGMRAEHERAYQTEMDDAAFVKQLLDMGKKLGIVPNEFNPAKKSEDNNKEGTATKSEDVLSDLTYGASKKPMKVDEPTSIDMKLNRQEQKAKKQDQTDIKQEDRKDKRGLIASKI